MEQTGWRPSWVFLGGSEGFLALPSFGAAKLVLGDSKGRVRERETTSLAFCAVPNTCNNMDLSESRFSVRIVVNACGEMNPAKMHM